MVNIKNYMNLKGFVILLAVILFILLNSTQESYIPLDQIDYTTLETIQTGSETSWTSSLPVSTTTTTFPEITGSIPQPSSSPSSFSPATLIAIVTSIFFIGVIVLLIMKRKNFVTYGSFTRPKREHMKTITEKREIFRTQIVTLKDILLEYLDDKKYTEGVIYGFLTLDKNMKKLLGLKRKRSLTPKEFAESLELPEIIQNLKNIVNLFYRARYKLEKLKKDDLLDFINNLDIIKEKSKTAKKIEIRQVIVKEE
ncbi:MAG: hypothetical protein K9W46_11425 [Candidatus Heimdallarchaeum endolithica]|uniref:DUF4129 domain-containing protein n=1 Tax=Candidatus Heimdallarchaeum endolithica TaxID=2876572 RepID=A0A9Y1FNS9_9ARCH|nr:MAG: hypothetical protein K9W46_11425 [Candidatus Heimdallarchaeum endolithica]